jgi:putative ABC transport system permease protein
VELLAGRFPQPVTDPQGVVEAVASQSLAETLGLQPGDMARLEDFDGSGQPAGIQVRLSGIIGPPERNSRARLYAPRFLDEALTLPEESYLNVVALNIVPSETEITWAANYDESTINAGNVGRILGGLSGLRFQLTNQFEAVQVLTSLDSVLQSYRRNIFMLRGLMIVLGAPVIGMALYFVAISTRLVVETQRGEIAVLKSRGSSTIQVVGLLLAQGVMMTALAVALAPWLAMPVAQLIGRSTNFLVFDNPRLLPVTFQAGLYRYAIFVGILALLAIVWPTIKTAQLTIVTYRHAVAREKLAFFIHRYYLDLILLLASGWGLWQLTQHGSILSQTESGGLQIDPLLLLTPIGLVAGLTFLALRVTPLLIQALAGLTSRTGSVAALFAFQQIARAPTRYFDLVLLLTFTLALGLFTAIVASTFNRNYDDQAAYAVGADLRAREFDHERGLWTVRPPADYQAIPGVQAVSPARRARLVGRRAEIRARGTLLALDPTTFADVAWWRSDFRPTLDEILTLLRRDERGILADETFVKQHRLKPGDRFEIDVEGKPVTFVLLGTVGYFPTLYPEDGSQFVARLSYLQKLRALEASEVWLRTAEDRGPQIAALLNQDADGLILTQDGHDLAVLRTDPLQVGLFGTLSLGFVAASSLSILGFLLYAYTDIQQRALQFGVLRATGLSVSQLIATLSAEQLTLVGLSILLGTALGSSAGWLFTRFLQVSIIARQAVPPFLIVTPWSLIGRMYLVLFVLLAVVLLVSAYLLRRLRIHATLRLGEV